MLKFDEKGLIPVVVQDADTNEVLTLAYMSEESLRRTLASGEVWFFSRSGGNCGTGATRPSRPGGRLQDCDGDALLVKCTPAAPPVTGERSFLPGLEPDTCRQPARLTASAVRAILARSAARRIRGLSARPWPFDRLQRGGGGGASPPTATPAGQQRALRPIRRIASRDEGMSPPSTRGLWPHGQAHGEAEAFSCAWVGVPSYTRTDGETPVWLFDIRGGKLHRYGSSLTPGTSGTQVMADASRRSIGSGTATRTRGHWRRVGPGSAPSSACSRTSPRGREGTSLDTSRATLTQMRRGSCRFTERRGFRELLPGVLTRASASGCARSRQLVSFCPGQQSGRYSRISVGGN
jgi:phosphoribosyl-AMP cyclohydrolase